MENKELVLRANIVVALFRATNEQTLFLNKELKQKPKQVFNIWQKQGFKLQDELDKVNLVNDEYLNGLTDYFHDAIDILVKKFKEDEKNKGID